MRTLRPLTLRGAAARLLVMALALCLTTAAGAPARAAAIDPIALALEVGAPQQAAAAGDPVLNFQGRLLDPITGLAKPDGSYPMSFRLYAVESGGSPLWTESRTVAVQRSIFTVLLGEVTALDPAVFNGQPLWLGVTVGGDPEMAPRTRLAHAPYALLANRVKDGAVTGASVADGSLGAADVATGALTGANLADGGVALADIAANAIDGARIADGSITANDIANEQLDDARIRNTIRSVTIPAHALAWTHTSTIITPFAGSFGGGLRWQANVGNTAFAYLARPSDWDGASNVTLSIYLYPVAGGAGNIDFFIRPRSYDVGDIHNDANSLTSDGVVSAASTRQILEQKFTIPAATMQRALWAIAMQRGGPGESFTGDVAVLAVKLTYMAVR